jgi:chromosome segregation ATPase
MSERARGKSRKSAASTVSTSREAAAKALAPKEQLPSAKKTRKTSAKSPTTKTQTRPAADNAAGTSPLDAASLMARVIRLESERDRLQAQLEKAEKRIRELEESREQVVNRIDWVIDSLRSLVEE